MIKYFQVFISSSGVGMGEIRKELISKILARDRFFPIAMEHISASDDTLAMLYNYMKRSDICLLILGDSAGSKIGSASRYITDPDMLAAVEGYKRKSGLKNTEDLTYTEFEYAAAVHLGVKIVPFVKNSLAESFGTGTLSEETARFYGAVRERSICQSWTDSLNPDTVVAALDHCVDSHPDLAGWIREKEAPLELSEKTEAAAVDEKYWKEKEQAAILNMRRRKRNKNILIEVAAQHPLKDGLTPDTEFAARLDRAAELYHSKTAEGYGVKIYVPGSLHLDLDGVPDEVSLSEAGCAYLAEKGIPGDRLFGNEQNDRFDGERCHKGVYNTADECFVASKIFFSEEEAFGQLYCICSPNQLMRVNLFYIEFGIIPSVITVPTSNMFHNFLNELFESVPYILEKDRDYQSETSEEAIRTRKERLPGYAAKPLF